MDAVVDALFWATFVAWQFAPAALIVLLWRRKSLSLVAALFALAVSVAGTAYAWYASMTGSSSTAPLLLLYSPLYITFAVGVVYGIDLTVRAARRRGPRT